MKTSVVTVTGLALSFALLPLFAFADTNLTASVDVPDHCTVVDTDGVSHTYSGYLGICALETAKENGAISSVQLSNQYPSFGLFVTGINGIAADPDSEYWALYQNGGFASAGLSTLSIAAGDTLTLELHDFSDTYEGTRLTIAIHSLLTSAPVSTVGDSSLTLHDPFSIPLAVNYLWGQQHKDGSFDTPLLTDWIAIASAGGNAGDMESALRTFEQAQSPVFTSVTDDERHAMALEALGLNPYNGTAVDYITPIVQSFDGTQIGDRELINDDIFAIFPLIHAGYTVNDPVISQTTAFIISGQNTDGSWVESPDLTAAAIQALEIVHSLPGTPDAIAKGLYYLHSAQKNDGGFGNASATSWVLQAIESVGQSPFDWDPNSYHTPEYYLSTFQQEDGGVERTNTDAATRIWETAYAIPAIEHKSWDALLQSFPKPLPVATSTAEVTTSTPVSSTSTSEVVVSAPNPEVISSSEENPATAEGSAVSDSGTTTDAVQSSSTAQAASAAVSGSDPLNIVHGFINWFFTHIL